MGKIIFEYDQDDPDDMYYINRGIKSIDMALALSDIKESLRDISRYNPNNNTDEFILGIEAARDIVNQTLYGRNLDLEELLQ